MRLLRGKGLQLLLFKGRDRHLLLQGANFRLKFTNHGQKLRVDVVRGPAAEEEPVKYVFVKDEVLLEVFDLPLHLLNEGLFL